MLLFFSTEITLNINGHASSEFTQARGLRQGDPLSPLLFNLAFEPLLAYIQSAQDLHGITIPGRDTAIKLSAFADDLLIYLASLTEWHWLEETLQLYGRASNAKVNLAKTVAFPMGKEPNAALKAHLETSQIQWHDKNKEDALTYLGFPVAFSKQQAANYWDRLTTKIQGALAIHSTRSLSVLGRGTVVNALVLARMWHIVWVATPTRQFNKQLHKIIRDFMCPFKPQPGWAVITTPRTEGGLGVIDPDIQAQAFQLKHLINMASDSVSWGKKIILDIIQWKTKSEHPLAPLLAPEECELNKRMKGYPGVQRIVVALATLPSRKDRIMTDRLPDAATIMASPVSWWLPKADHNDDSADTTRRMEEFFGLDQADPVHDRIVSKAISARLREEKAQLVRDIQDHTRTLSNQYIQAAASPAKIARGDGIATLIRETNIATDEAEVIELQNANTKQLRRFLTALTQQPHNPTSSINPETGSKQQWKSFWGAKIPHRARTIWWRYKRDILPCGILRHRLWNQDPACDMEGCDNEATSKNHYVFQCKAKYDSWQGILQTYTTKMDWPDNDLNSLLSFDRPQFDIRPEYSISPAQLIACGLIGIAQAIKVRFVDDRSLSATAIQNCMRREIDRTMNQNRFVTSHQ
ncbi:unnamed protein product [Mortierella alpina]